MPLHPQLDLRTLTARQTPTYMRHCLIPLHLCSAGSLAGRTVGFVGADLAALCREAALHAIKRYLQTDDESRCDLDI
jgi:SpoVK/Ycf46/Vps4 family AAA+-type ATPase